MSRSIMRQFFLLSVVFFYFFSLGCRMPHAEEEGIGPVNLDVVDKPLQEVSKDIADQTGYHIVISEKWKKNLVSGKFINITVEDFFRRALKGFNVFLTVDTRRKTIVVQTVGQSLAENLRTSGGGENTFAAEIEVTPGTKRIDVVEGPAYGAGVDPMDLEITPGIRRRDVVESTAIDQNIDPMQLEVTPGTKRIDVVEGPAYGAGIDPMDLEITPGIRRRDVVKGNVAHFLGKGYAGKKNSSMEEVRPKN